MKKITIFIVEDEFLIALSIKRGLIRKGYEVYPPVAKGEDAIDMVRKTEPDVILVDINLIGDIDGIETAKQIGLFSSAMIIFTTGYQDPNLKKRALELNPAGFLLKPINIDEVVNIIETINSEK